MIAIARTQQKCFGREKVVAVIVRQGDLIEHFPRNSLITSNQNMSQ